MPSLNSPSTGAVGPVAPAAQGQQAPASTACGAPLAASAVDARPRAHAGRDRYWRSLEEFADTPEFREIVEREFSASATDLVTPEDRRQFIKVMGASFALAGLAMSSMSGCRRWPEQNIHTFTRRPENRTPGATVQFATTLEFGGFAQGLLVTSVDGRPIKVEGNPDHPINAGSSDTLAQASILDLYDIDRSREVHEGEKPSTWAAFAAAAATGFGGFKASAGEGLAILAAPTSSPAAQRIRERLAKAMPKARLIEWQAVDMDSERQGTAIAFGKPHRVQTTFAGDGVSANVVLSLDADFLLDHPAAIRSTREFARTRRTAHVSPDAARMSRLYMLDSGCSITGVMADERIPLRAADVAPVAAAIAAACGVSDAAITALSGAPSAAKALDAHGTLIVKDCAKDLLANKGASLVVAGRHQPPEVHALAALLNEALGNVGRTVSYTPDADRPARSAGIAGLAKAISDKTVSALVIIDSNPVYDAPADLDFVGLLKQVPFSVHCGLYRDETARRCAWHVPMAHGLESWADARSFDGTYTLGQPLIEPMIDPGQGGRSALEFLADVADWCEGAKGGRKGQALVRETFVAMVGLSGEAAEAAWRKALHLGLLPGSATGAATVRVNAGEVAKAASALASRLSNLAPAAMEVVLRPDAKIRDGRYANNAWLQELPEPISKLTWDNAAVMSLVSAQAMGVARGDMLRISANGRTLEIPALPVPGHPEGSISIALGYGRGAEAGRVAEGAGFNGYALRSSTALDFFEARVEKAGGTYPLVSTQDRGAGNPVAERGIQDRLPTLVRASTLEHYREHPDWAKHPTEDYHVASRLSLWEESNLAGAKHRWAMTIDLSTCTGCNACMVACQAENNVPVVGKEQVRRGRDMSWIRIDRYFKGDDPARPQRALFQPVTCMQCENAPCEQVCPVAATVHDEEGLNTMVYNRCVGTRYCSNNCPYKVRRFNYFDWHRMDLKRTSDWIQPQADYYLREQSNEWKQMQFNPEVTVRMRGVMEKCTFCTQRIAKAKIDAKNAWAKQGGREGGTSDYVIRDGAITPACAQACPAQAIVFGDLNDPESRVSRLFKAKLAYEMLEELNVKPRVKYLARLDNPAHDHGGHGGHDHDHDHGAHDAHGMAPAKAKGGLA